MKIYLALCLLWAALLNGYHIPAGVPEDVWQQVQPYLLPETHPIKPKLDKLFSKSRHTHDLTTLLLGGFDFKVREKKDQIIVAKHRKLKGIVLKLYTDAQLGIPDWTMWIKRIQGAQEIQKVIHSLAAERYFKVPQKWIYPLPDKPYGKEGTHPKRFILIVENMHVKSANANEWMWQSPFIMNEERMRLLYLILQQAGLNDSVYIDNVPFCSDGRQAFIDTEHYFNWPVPLDRLLNRFPEGLQKLWRQWITVGM